MKLSTLQFGAITNSAIWNSYTCFLVNIWLNFCWADTSEWNFWISWTTHMFSFRRHCHTTAFQFTLPPAVCGAHPFPIDLLWSHLFPIDLLWSPPFPYRLSMTLTHPWFISGPPAQLPSAPSKPLPFLGALVQGFLPTGPAVGFFQPWSWRHSFKPLWVMSPGLKVTQPALIQLPALLRSSILRTMHVLAQCSSYPMLQGDIQPCLGIFWLMFLTRAKTNRQNMLPLKSWRLICPGTVYSFLDPTKSHISWPKLAVSFTPKQPHLIYCPCEHSMLLM